MAELSGTGLVADDLFLLAHDDVTGRPFLQPRALGLGLAGGLLAESFFADVVRVRGGRVMVTGQGMPADGLGPHVVSVLLREEEEHAAGELLAFLAGTAGRDVASRLARSGYLIRVSSRRPWRGGRWVPADSDCAFAPLGRVRAVLDPARRATVADCVLAGLAAACGLGWRLLPYGPPGARRCLDEAVRYLDPGLRELIAQTQAAVDAAVLSYHG